MRRMTSSPSRYRPEGSSDYSHRFHAGNVGDVWKHCVLTEVLRRMRGGDAPVVYVESHAGEGTYPLGPTGEWTEGIGRVWSSDGERDDAVGRYVALARTLGAGDARPECYPGSPLLAAAILDATARMRLWERDPEAAVRLRAALASDARVEVSGDDGLAALPNAVRDAEATGATVVGLVDPPFTQKPDWIAVPDALIAIAAASTRATLLLWYPVKSLTRPNAMIARLKAAGIAATVAELVTTPLEHQRQRLNGSGMILVRPPAGAVAAIAAAAPVLGDLCATRPGAWSLRVVAW
jgi:23S rRNA (adenine2030-N6)-methyltransferase